MQRLTILPALSLMLAAAGATDLDLDVVPSDLAPEVEVHDYSNRHVEEYRVNGRLYMIKITPVTGAPYYLLDEDGTGRMEYRRDAAGRDIRVPQWTLFSW